MICSLPAARTRAGIVVGLVVLAGAAAMAFVGPARAASLPSLLWQVPEDGLAGIGAGQFDNPDGGIAADPATGHLFVGDRRNSRVDEFDAWGQFVKAWGWGVADGAGELQTCGPQASPPTATCLKGLKGSGAGQFKQLLGGLAVDGSGDVYVGDMENHRVEKFDSAGHFLLSFGDEGTGPGQFATDEFGQYIAVGPSGTVFVGDTNRVEEFNPDGTFKSEFRFEGELESLKEKPVKALAVDSKEDLYMDVAGVGEVLKVSPTGSLVPPKAFPVERPSALAADANGNIYVTSYFREIVEFDPNGNQVVASGEKLGEYPSFETNSGYQGAMEGLATNVVSGSGGVDVYATQTNGEAVSLVQAYGAPPDKWLPPAIAPEITSQYAVLADPEAATVRAQIDPEFWSDTSFLVEYGTGKCSEGGCSPSGSVALGSGVVRASVTTTAVVLTGLAPGTTYHYRFVAQSGGGGPVRGVGGTVGQDGTEGTFTTPFVSSAPGADPCANALLRIGPSAFLPDCRAYEMVSPIDKNGGDIVPLLSLTNVPASFDMSAEEGGRFTYSAYRAFGDAQAAPVSSQYVATREGGGWGTHDITPVRETEIPKPPATAALDVEYSAFSPDLCSGWLRHTSDPPLAPDAVEGFVNIYSQGVCGGEPFEAVTTVKPPHTAPSVFSLELQGVSADGKHAIYVANDVLAAGAPALGTVGEVRVLYDDTEGHQRYVCVLPDGTPYGSACTAGSGQTLFGDDREDAVSHAISADGSKVYWTAGSRGPAPLYLRTDPERAQSKVVSGKCTEPEKACTFAVSQTAEAESKAAGSQFWTAAPDGSKALFTTGNISVGPGSLYEFDASTDKASLIAPGVLGVLGASEDASRVYFASVEALAPGANKGEPNLYLYQAGVGTRFVAALSAADVKALPANWDAVSISPYKHAARASADGLQLVFMSTASPTGYDNLDVNSAEPDAEVYLYDASASAGAGALHCLSCNPTGARPDGRNQEFEAKIANHWVAARVPGWTSQLYQSRYLSADGKRVFFDSYDALVQRDVNGAEDVYEWEAPSEGDCTEQSSSFSAMAGGCVSLISSGESPQDSEFLDASAAGSDVFFSTASSLSPQDPGLIDVYDARVDGGFAQPVPAGVCEGEACQNPPAPPIDSTPASLTFSGNGNVAAPAPAVTVAVKSKKLSRAQQLAKALRACKPKPRKQRARCEAQAKKRYGRGARKR